MIFRAPELLGEEIIEVRGKRLDGRCLGVILKKNLQVLFKFWEIGRYT
jgi:hypothetical protein